MATLTAPILETTPVITTWAKESVTLSSPAGIERLTTFFKISLSNFQDSSPKRRNELSFLTTIYIKIKPTTNCAIPVPSAAPATPKFNI